MHDTAAPGVLDFDVDSFAAAVGDRWKSRLNNMAMVVDLGPFPRLVTIKGNFDAKKGSEAGYVGDPADPVNFPAPQLELSDALREGQGHPADPRGAARRRLRRCLQARHEGRDEQRRRQLGVQVRGRRRKSRC